MKRIILAVVALLMAAPLLAIEERNSSKNIVDEVIRMWQANVGEENIVAYVHKADARFSVSADDIIAMTDAKVPRTVIKAVLDEADARGDRSRPVERRTVYVAPSYSYGGWYGPAYYNPWFYDPFWYSPRVSIGFGIGFGRFGGGRFHRRW